MTGKCTHTGKIRVGSDENKGFSLWDAPLGKRVGKKMGLQESTNNRNEYVLYTNSVNGEECAH